MSALFEVPMNDEIDDLTILRRWFDGLKDVACVTSVKVHDGDASSDYVRCTIEARGMYPSQVTYGLPSRLHYDFLVSRDYDEGISKINMKIIGGKDQEVDGQARPTTTYIYNLPREVFQRT